MKTLTDLQLEHSAPISLNAYLKRLLWIYHRRGRLDGRQIRLLVGEGLLRFLEDGGHKLTARGVRAVQAQIDNRKQKKETIPDPTGNRSWRYVQQKTDNPESS